MQFQGKLRHDSLFDNDGVSCVTFYDEVYGFT